MQAVRVDCHVHGAQLVHHLPLVQAHVVLAGRLNVGCALGAESLGSLSVQAQRHVARGVPQHCRRKGLGDVNPEENLHRRRQQHTAYRTAGQQPAEGPVQPLPAPHSPPGDRRWGSPVCAPPSVAALCHDGGRERLGHKHTLIHHQPHAGWATVRANPIVGLCWLWHRPYRLL